MSEASTPSRHGHLVTGILSAVLWGLLFEAGAQLLATLADPAALYSAARIRRVLEVGGLCGVTGAGAGLLTLALSRPWSGPVAGASGLALAVFLAGLALGTPPPDDIRFSTDPLVQRSLAMAISGLLAAAMAVAVAIGARRGAFGATAHWTVRGAATAVACAAVVLLAAGGERSDRPDVFLVSIDTLRADRLGCYGYPLETSPAVDALCRRGVVFEHALTPVPETIPAYTSIMTGRIPADHGVYNNFQSVDDSVETLAERLSAAGYRTAAFLHGPLPGTYSNLDQGFDLIVQRGLVARSKGFTPWDSAAMLLGALKSQVEERLHLDTSATTGFAARWIREIPRRGEPLFAHVYWGYPHGAYEPPPVHLKGLPEPADGSETARLQRLYDGEVRFTDEQIRMVLEAIDESSGPDGAWIVFTADHGEELGRVVPEFDEPYFGHSFFLYESSLHVPLVVVAPRSAALPPGRNDALVSTASVVPTLLAELGLEGGEALMPELPLREDRPAQLPTAVMRKRDHPKSADPVDRVSIRDGDLRLLESRSPSYTLEIVRYGPDGQPEVVADDPRAADLLRKLHEIYPLDANSAAGPDAASLSERERELLRSLGYIE